MSGRLTRLPVSLLALIIFACSFNANASPVPDAKKGAYDSSVNFLAGDVLKYVGQEIYLIEKPETERDFGYSGFYNSANSKEDNVYHPNTQYYTIYHEVAGRYFQVLEVVKHPEAPSNELFDNGKCFLKLKEKDSSAIMYFEYNSNNQFAFPFIVVGFYEKQKKVFRGRDMMFTDNILKTYASKTDYKTNRTVAYITAQMWKCIDMVIPKNGRNIMMVMQDVIGQQMTIPFGTKYYNLRDAEAYKKKFGEPVFKKLLTGGISIGMTKEMCKLSIGEPYAVKGELQHGTGDKREEWQYDDGQSLFFVNDHLVDIQKTVKN